MAEDQNQRFDPIEAFFSGIGSGFIRLLIGMAAIALGYLINLWSSSYEGWGIDSVFMIFWWGHFGLAFFVGFAALLGGLYTLYRFVVDEGGKMEWFVIVSAFTLYYLPMNLPGNIWYWEADDRIRLLVLLSIFSRLSATYWLLPLGISIVVERCKKHKEGPNDHPH